MIRPQERFGDWHELNNYSLERTARQDQPLLSLSDNLQTKEELAGQEHATSDKATEGRIRRTAAVVGEFKRRDGVLQ